MKENLTRRNFFKWSLLSLPLIKAADVFAKMTCPLGLPKDTKIAKKVIKTTNRAIKRLKFVFDATKATDKKYKKGSTCGSCNFYKFKKQVENYAPCPMVGNKYVPSCGWCKSYRLTKKKRA